MKKCEISQIQQQFWVLQKLYPDTTAYNLPYMAIIKGDFCIDTFNNAINTIVSRYDMLRTIFTEDGGKVFQYVKDPEECKIKTEITKVDTSFVSDPLSCEVYELIHRPFDIGCWPYFRAGVFEYSNETVLVLVFHHIIFDLVTAGNFFKELSALYKSYYLKQEPDAELLANNYFEYSDWLRDWQTTENAQKKLEEWRNFIPSKPEKLEFANTTGRSKVSSDAGKRIHLVLDEFPVAEISQFAEKNAVNDFIVLLSAYAVLLNKLTNKSEINIGVPFRNRRKTEFRNTFGCFVNILPLPVRLSDDLTGTGLMKQILSSMFKVDRKEEVPYLLLNSLLGPGDGSGLFQAGFTFDPGVHLDLEGAEVNAQFIERDGAQLDLFFSLWEISGKYHVYLEYSSDLFNREMAESIWGIYKTILKSMMTEPDHTIMDMDIAPDGDLAFINELNDTNAAYEESLCIHEKFEQQVQKTPHSDALLFNDQSLTYRELDEHANRTANRLIKDGIEVEDVVCTCLERSAEMMIGIFGVLKAGAAYLPLNPDTPSERLKTIIGDANPKLILTTKSSSVNIPDGTPLLFIEDILKTPLSDNISKPATKVTSRNKAYIIYTSGSTGVPKGVMIEHHSVLNRLGWMQKAYPIDQSDTLIQKTPTTFDVSVWELFWWSFYGARLLLLPPGGEKSPETIIQHIEKYRVTTIHFVPSMFIAFQGMVKSRNMFSKLTGLRRIFMSGEALPLKVVEEFNEMRSEIKLPDIINLYGPTEATVDVSFYNCPADNIKQVYIGKPIDNTKLFVVNSKMKIQPVGIPGELLITGVNLARGYMNHPELTAERFFDFKISKEKSVRAYRTGDLVKLTKEGEIDYIGRIDNQVKIRGFRIELGDIESQIHKHPDVTNCAVIVTENSDTKSLVAYICLKPGAKTDIDEMRRFLTSKLQDYMVPSFFIFIDHLPLTTSGKLDRKALPKPERKSSADEIVLPANSIEKSLSGLWKECLKVESISINDNFFESGGNSLLAINLATLISKEFNIIFSTITVFEYPNIKGQSEFISGLINKNDRIESDNNIEDKIKMRKNVDFQKRRF
ncbi:MAG TPA: amino acid adenylation domain-containing protein [Bacteroidales bacterium]|nr:amino acid adenylation domain-containing protein [Bacteroidales bacterium]